MNQAFPGCRATFPHACPDDDRVGWRGCFKTKNRDYWRYEMEREGAFKVRRKRQFV
jgi:hypothetical protein